MSSPDPTKTKTKPKSSYGNPSFADIARSMVVIGVIVVGLFVVGQFFWGTTPDERTNEVDFAEVVTTVESVRTTAPYPIYAPSSLPDGWWVNGVTFDPGVEGRWHLGVLTDDDKYIGLEQKLDSAPRMVDTYAPEGVEEQGDAQVAGETWQVWTGGDETTFVREEGEMTVLVTGSAPRNDIERYIGLLTTD